MCCVPKNQKYGSYVPTVSLFSRCRTSGSPNKITRALPEGLSVGSLFGVNSRTSVQYLFSNLSDDHDGSNLLETRLSLDGFPAIFSLTKLARANGQSSDSLGSGDKAVARLIIVEKYIDSYVHTWQITSIMVIQLTYNSNPTVNPITGLTPGWYEPSLDGMGSATQAAV